MEEKRLIEVRTYEDGDTKHVFSELIERVSVKCPYCDTMVMPTYMLIKDVDLHHYNAFCQCTNCSETFILEYERRNTGFNFKQLHHNPMLKKKEFGELIGEVSPSFSDIYNPLLIILSILNFYLELYFLIYLYHLKIMILFYHL